MAIRNGFSHDENGEEMNIAKHSHPLWNRLQPHGLVYKALLMVCLLSVGVDADDPVREEETPIANQIQAGPRSLSRAFRAAASKATPSVVTVLSYGQQSVLQRMSEQQAAEDGSAKPQLSGKAAEETLTGIGSGVIVSASGMVITNNHVITGAKRVMIRLSDETEIEATDVRGDPDSDVATLRVNRDAGFVGAGLADSELLEIGDWVLAIGSPFRLEATVSAGIISAKNRSLRRIKRGRLIQTDAAINPGNSGGPLIDLDGNVVAISTAIATRNGGYQGIGFAIPINSAKWIADELAGYGEVRRAAIGTRNAELNPKIAAKFSLTPWMGVLVYQVIENSVAQRAGLKPLDVIVEFAGERVRDPASLQEAIERKLIGSLQELKVFRNGEEVTLNIELAAALDPTGGATTKKTEEKNAEEKEEVTEEEEATEDSNSSESDGASESESEKDVTSDDTDADE